MVLHLDHVVVVVHDLAQAIADYSEAGFTVTPGGEHADGMTHNALIAFADDSYIELIAFKQPDQPQSHPWWPRLAHHEGLVDFALISDDLERDVKVWRGRGLAVYGPRDGGRQRLDGQTLRWRTALLYVGVKDTPLPFIIQDVTPHALRVPSGAATSHALPITGIQGITIAVHDLSARAHDMERLLGATPQIITPNQQQFTIGKQWISIVSADATPDLLAYTQAVGESPYAIALMNSGSRAKAILPDLTHGVRIGFVD